MSHTPTPTRRDSDGHLRYLLTAYLFENLSAAGRKEVETHLAACASCREEFERLKKTLGLATNALKLDSVEYQFDARRRERVMATAEEAMQHRSSQRIGVAKVSSAKKAERSAAKPNRKGTAQSYSLSRTLLVVIPMLLVGSLLLVSMTSMSVRHKSQMAANKIGNAVESSTSKGLEDGGFDDSGSLKYSRSPAPAPAPAAEAEAKSDSVVVVTELAKPKDAVEDVPAATFNSNAFKDKEGTYHRRVEYPPENKPSAQYFNLQSPTDANVRTLNGAISNDPIPDIAGGPGGAGGKDFDGLLGGQKPAPRLDHNFPGYDQNQADNTKSKNSEGEKLSGRAQKVWAEQGQQGQHAAPEMPEIQTASKEAVQQAQETVKKTIETPRTKFHRSGGGCFPAGTLVKTESGFQAIEKIQPGTQVFACNPASGEWSLQPVTQVLTHEYAGDLITIQSGGTVFEATGNHPLWVCSGEQLAARPRVKDLRGETQLVTTQGRWVEARDLREGDQLITPAGRVNLNVLKTQETRQTVFNVTVTKEHTYAVSALGILVHNKDDAMAEEDTRPTKPNATNMSTIEVPPEILGKAELKDHFETINPDRPDTKGTYGFTDNKTDNKYGPNSKVTAEPPHSAFGNPDAHMFHETTDDQVEAKKKPEAPLADSKPDAEHWSKLPPTKVTLPPPEKPKSPLSRLPGKDNTEGVPETPRSDQADHYVESDVLKNPISDKFRNIDPSPPEPATPAPTKPDPAKNGRWLFADPKTELSFDTAREKTLDDVVQKEEVLKGRKQDIITYKSELNGEPLPPPQKWGDGNGKGLVLYQGMTESEINGRLKHTEGMTEEEIIKLKGTLIKQQQAVAVEREGEAGARSQKEKLESDLNAIKAQVTDAFKPRLTELELRQRKLQERQDSIRLKAQAPIPNDLAQFREVQEVQAEEAKLKAELDILSRDVDQKIADVLKSRSRIELPADLKTSESLLRGFDFARSSMPDLRFQDYVAHPQAVPPAERTDWGLDEDAFIEQKGYRPFVDCARDHLSTFGMDVATASYTRTRGLLQEGRMPEPEEVRTEEFVNYFKEFGLGQSVPASDTFAVWAECAPEALNTPSSNTPAAELKRSSGERIELLKVAIASREPRADERKPAVLTLVVDVSGSMRQAQSTTNTADRLELVRDALKDLITNLQPEDTVCIVAFHEQASLALPRTQARQKQRILEAIDGLTPHGGTNVEAGLQLGYRMAEEAFSADGVNRVLLCSDGVANTGARGPDELKSLVKTFAGRGIDLNAIGFGLGQYNDKMLEQLAQTGNGACFFVDKLDEAKKVFKEQLPPNLNVLARDAKVQVEFNPERVERYRLLGYEKRKIKDEDFRNDKVDGGEVAHQTRVTALYELIMKEGQHGPLGKVFLRWKDAGLRHLPVIERNYPLEEQVRSTESSPELRLLNCVAAFAELLNQNPHRRDSSFTRIQEELERLPDAYQRHPKVQELRAMLAAAQKAWIAQNLKALNAGISK